MAKLYNRLAVLTAAFLPLIAAPELTGVTVEAGTKVTKTFESFLNLELVEMSISLDGEEKDLPAGESPTKTMSDEEEVVFVDEYVKVEGGRGVEILRTYETLSDMSMQSITPPGSDETMEDLEEGESPFLDLTVKFVWDADEEEYVATFVDADDADDDLLEDLHGDADFLYLLSDGPMEEGSSWDIDIEAFDFISSPSGNLQINDPDSEDEEDDEAFSEAFNEGLEGEMTGTVESIDEGVVTILIECSVSTSFEMDRSDGGEGPVQGFELTFDLEGKLLWDLEKGTASEFELEGDVEMTVILSGDMQGMEFAQTQRFEGELKSSATFE
ncbi:MAG: hypothetical protein ACJA0P_001660 [Planctomycetota bacterium]